MGSGVLKHTSVRFLVILTVITVLIAAVISAAHFVPMQERVLEAKFLEIRETEKSSDKAIDPISVVVAVKAGQKPTACGWVKNAGIPPTGETPGLVHQCNLSPDPVLKPESVCSRGDFVCLKFRFEAPPPEARGVVGSIRSYVADNNGHESFPFLVAKVQAEGRTAYDLRAETVREGTFRKLPYAAGKVDFVFPETPGLVRRLGNQANEIAPVVADWEITATNAIIYLLGLLTCGSVLSFFGRQVWLYRRRFFAKDWPDRINTIHQDISGALRSELSGEPLRKQQNKQRGNLVKLLEKNGDGDRRPTDELSNVLRASLYDYYASGDLPLRSLDANFQTLAMREETTFASAWMAMTAFVSPALGFLGTVIGMTKAFCDMHGFQVMGDDGFVTAMRIALVTTVLGLMVRILVTGLEFAFDHIRNIRLERTRALAVSWCTAFSETLAVKNGSQELEGEEESAPEPEAGRRS